MYAVYSGLNRTIIGLKECGLFEILNVFSRLNRTIIGLKDRVLTDWLYDLTCLNRTIIGLKGFAPQQRLLHSRV